MVGVRPCSVREPAPESSDGHGPRRQSRVGPDSLEVALVLDVGHYYGVFDFLTIGMGPLRGTPEAC